MAADTKDDVQDIEMEQDDNKKKKSRKKKSGSSKFLPFGKYFLLVLVLAAQSMLAYTIVDKNYASVYEYLKKSGPSDPIPYDMEQMVVNPAGTNGQRYLLLEVSLELGSEDDVTLLDKNKLKIRHDMIEFLSSRTVSQLVHFNQRESLRRDLIGIINTAVGSRSVRNLYYTKYVMQ